jgi:hypothetical protein
MRALQEINYPLSRRDSLEKLKIGFRMETVILIELRDFDFEGSSQGHLCGDTRRAAALDTLDCPFTEA